MKTPSLVTLTDGTTLLVPDEMRESMDAAMVAGIAAGEDALASRTAFVSTLLTQLHGRGFFLIPRAHVRTREAVDANVYSAALSRKAAVERDMKRVADLLFPLVHRIENGVAIAQDLREMLKPTADHSIGEQRDSIQGVIDRLDMVEEILRPPAGALMVPE